MSTYFVKGKGWRYDFVHQSIRYTEAGYNTKRKAKQAEAKRREDLKKPQLQQIEETKIPTDMAFLDLVNHRLDYINSYNSETHYTDHVYMAKRWVKQWGKLQCSEISPAMIQAFLLKRKRAVSGHTANKELRAIRALFNFAMHPARDWMTKNPTRGIEFFPVEKTIKYVPPKEDVLRVIMAAEPDTTGLPLGHCVDHGANERD